MDFSYLDIDKTAFETALDGTLRVMGEDKCGMRVEALRAFPLTHPEEHIVLRDGAGKELGVLRDLRQLGEADQELVREQLRRRYFLPVVTAIHSVTERFGSSIWELETDRGPCSVTTRAMNEAVFEVEPNRFLITDVENNRYEIKNLVALDAPSRARFQGKS